MRHPREGDQVRVQRDEKLYPSKGTWPLYRGRVGTVVSVNADHRSAKVRERERGIIPLSITEYGVSFTKSPDAAAWFKGYELRIAGVAVLSY